MGISTSTATMCHYAYFHSEACRHLTVEISEYCARTKWSAGLTGVLRPCPEEKYASHFTDLLVQVRTPYVWEGQSNFCRKCEVEFSNSLNLLEPFILAFIVKIYLSMRSFWSDPTNRLDLGLPASLAHPQLIELNDSDSTRCTNRSAFPRTMTAPCNGHLNQSRPPWISNS
jgi:hypothetical protein